MRLCPSSFHYRLFRRGLEVNDHTLSWICNILTRLGLLPRTITNLADEPYEEWKRHMIELYNEARSELNGPGKDQDGFKTLLGKASYNQLVETDH
jgi:hypothetical protein